MKWDAPTIIMCIFLLLIIFAALDIAGIFNRRRPRK